MTRKKGNLFIVSAPSGAGKTTLCQKLFEAVHDIKPSVSYTTRSPRPGEVDGVHYTFVDEGEIRTMIAEGEFVEWAEVHGNFYGTSRRRIEDMVNAGMDVMLDIDVQGARQVREKFPDSVLIFILPPSMDALKKRLAGRMSDSEEVIARRLRKASDEIGEYKNYDYVIVNNDLDEALKEMMSIIIAERAGILRIDHDWVRETFLKED